MRWPDFFIVGAPKCGTTSLHEYLAQHPSIFMARKELHYFGSDLRFSNVRPRTSLPAYQSHFSKVGPSHQRVGESSVWYLYSEKAPDEILARSPGAQIIVLLRNPVEMLYSLHTQLLYSGEETVTDFRQALDLEWDRRKGRCVPIKSFYPPALYYRDVGRYVDRVSNYISVFGRGRVRIILFDDLKQNAPVVYRDTLRFLHLDDVPLPAYARHNSAKSTKSETVHQILTGRKARFVNRTAKKIIPLGVRNLASTWIQQLNSRPIERPPMPPDLRLQLENEFRPEIEKLGRLLDRDLSHWFSLENRAALVIK